MKLADKISYKLIQEVQKSAYEIVIPNFYLGNYEMDLFRLLKSGYIYEYEIKISRADFFNDFKKSHKKHLSPYPRFEEVFKHDEIKKGKGKANRFFFVIKKGIVSVDEVPEYAGLIEYENEWFTTTKPAPLLHRRKSESTEFFKDLATSLSFREINHRFKNIRLKAKYEQLKNK